MDENLKKDLDFCHEVIDTFINHCEGDSLKGIQLLSHFNKLYVYSIIKAYKKNVGVNGINEVIDNTCEILITSLLASKEVMRMITNNDEEKGLDIYLQKWKKECPEKGDEIDELYSNFIKKWGKKDK